MKAVKLDLILSLAIVAVIVSHYLNLFPAGVDSIVIISIAICGTLPVAISAGRQILKREISMDLLASVALIFSILSGEWVSASFIALMISAARILKSITESQTERSIKSLFKLRPKKVRLIKGEKIEEVLAEKVQVGDIVVVSLGDQVPVDGKVVEGSFSADESSLTGESMPVDKNIGSRVFSSTIVVSGGARISVEKIGKDTTLEKIISLLESSTAAKPRFQTIGEKFGKIYLLGIFLVSAFVFFIGRDSKLVLSIILVICADDVAVAVPLAYLSAIRRAAKMGAVIKGSSYLEALGNADVIVFDKTGTLTAGKMKMSEIKTFSSYSEKELLSYCASLMEQSNHPVSKTIYEYAQKEGVRWSAAENVEEVGGMGISGDFSGKRITIGRKTFLKSQNITIDKEVSEEISKLEKGGRSNTFVVVDGEVAGIIALTDEVRTNAQKTIEHIKMLGVRDIVMLTGDNENVAGRVAEELGIKNFHAGLLPEDKVSFIKKMIGEGKTVAMVGDGVNDAAALRLSTVGIAMGAIGYDTAIESADIVLMKDDISKIANVIELARFTRRLSVQDFGIWGVSNVAGLSLVFGGIVGPTGAAAYNFLTDFFPLFNSIRKEK